MTQAGRLRGRVAIVTGAAHGIGAQYARALAAEGAAVAVADMHDTDSVARAIVKSGGNALSVTADVTDPRAARGMVCATVEHFGSVDILVNNAALSGKASPTFIARMDGAEWDGLTAVLECVKAAAPEMRKRRYGKIVNVSSGMLVRKAMVAITRSLARELEGDGIRVNVLTPGAAMRQDLLADPEWQAAIVRNRLGWRAARREPVADGLCGTLLYLCSADSDLVTGQVLVVDDGEPIH
jgi:NAD(P)-dependent dehydrogenase (short-subunit alcohol dehydrogenase family)